ncbi:MAG: LCP family protein [Firmicutes bacterium]|nr:LCP family protein [Bacillota bacterium]
MRAVRWLARWLVCALALYEPVHVVSLARADSLGAPDRSVHAQRLGPLRTLLVAGLDGDPESRDAVRRTENHTDVLVLMSSRVGSGVVNVLHIPRDTLVQTAWGPDKVNGVFRRGGQAALCSVVTALSGVPVQAVALVDFARFRKCIEFMGPLKFWVDRSIESPEGDVRIRAGWCQLNPARALAVVRFRHEPLGDIGRVHRQERFLRALVNRCRALPRAALGTLAQLVVPGASSSIVNQLYAVLHPLARYEAHSVPGVFSVGPGASYWLPDHLGLRALAPVLRSDEGRGYASEALAVWARRFSWKDADDGRDRSL